MSLVRLTPAEEKILHVVGEHLGRHQRAELAERVRIGRLAAKDTQRGSRKKRLTAVSRRIRLRRCVSIRPATSPVPDALGQS